MLELEGRLYLSKTGYLMLSVPNAVGIGAYQALNLPGLELPLHDSQKTYNAHITVMRPDELGQIGGSDVITERGKAFHYRLESIDACDSADEIYSRFFFYRVASPELSQLRRSYGLPGVPAVPFHITFAARRRNVLRENPIRKVAHGPVFEAAARGILLRGTG